MQKVFRSVVPIALDQEDENPTLYWLLPMKTQQFNQWQAIIAKSRGRDEDDAGMEGILQDMAATTNEQLDFLTGVVKRVTNPPVESADLEPESLGYKVDADGALSDPAEVRKHLADLMASDLTELIGASWRSKKLLELLKRPRSSSDSGKTESDPVLEESGTTGTADNVA